MFQLRGAKGKVHAGLTGVLNNLVLAEVRASGFKLLDKDRLVYCDGNEITIGDQFLKSLGPYLYDSSWVFELKDSGIEVRCSQYIHRRLSNDIKERMRAYSKVEELILRLVSLILVKRGGRSKLSVSDQALLQSHRRYELVRTLSPKEFAEIWKESLSNTVSFDQLVDQLIESKKVKRHA